MLNKLSLKKRKIWGAFGVASAIFLCNYHRKNSSAFGAAVWSPGLNKDPPRAPAAASMYFYDLGLYCCSRYCRKQTESAQRTLIDRSSRSWIACKRRESTSSAFWIPFHFHIFYKNHWLRLGRQGCTRAQPSLSDCTVHFESEFTKESPAIY